MRARATAILAAAATFISGTSQAFAGGDLVSGREKAQQCVACHGPGGVAPNPTFPHLAGQNAAYLEIQLEYFKNGQRFHPVMTPVAEALTPQDIEDLSAYFSAVGPLADAP
ncbi:c-type cytochrome [Chelativorans sp. YIM 93263]|uniref:c-type cytochrome n=1 Tax=Chelativorans sp. YIM 93263 TaxID=2906648 RepID=UPI00237887F6|nr:cytochrome c [Chelativorans sp. YIM 93263]